MVTCSHFSFDPERRTVRAPDGTPLHLTPKAFNLLQILIEAAPRVVPKAEFHARLWPDTFVSDAALTCLVKELRRVLRDVDDGTPLIRTAHGVGYAFEHTLSFSHAGRESMHWLVGSSSRHALKPGSNIIGRDATSDVRLEEVEVSRRHACVLVAGESATIEDLGSKNGTVVGDTPVGGRLELKDGDCIRAGSATLTYRRESCDCSTASMDAC